MPSTKPNYRLQVACDCCGAAVGEFCKAQPAVCDCAACQAGAAAKARGDAYCAGGMRQLANDFEGDLEAAQRFRDEQRALVKRKRGSNHNLH